MHEPINQKKLYGINDKLHHLINLYENDDLPNKILLSGQKGIGKSTLAYHLINYVFSKDEDYSYDKKNHFINEKNKSFKLVLNGSHPNFYLIDINAEKKNIDINQIRELILKLKKYSFNDKVRFVLIDNIEFLNINSINALLKILEEPNDNVVFILINNNKKILSTLLSRCINFKIFLTNQDSLNISNMILGDNIENFINKDLINFYSSPGNLLNLIKFSKLYKYDLKQMSLSDFLNMIIEESHYKKDLIIKNLIFEFVELFLIRSYKIKSSSNFKKYDYFIKRISQTKKFNLDEESLFIKFKEEILNG